MLRHFKTIAISITLMCLLFLFDSCLFDKEIKQDARIATYRYEMIKVIDSLHVIPERIKAYESIYQQIEGDEDLITKRKKNNLLIDCRLHIGAEYYKNEQYTKAINEYNMVLVIDSTNASAYYFRGNVYDATDNRELALNDYTKAIRLNPNYADAYYNRGIIYESKGDYISALEDYTATIKLNPSYASDIYTNRGNTYLELKKSERAFDDYNKAIEIDSTNSIAFCNRGNMLVGRAEYDAAIDDYNKALRLDSLNADIYNKRAFTYELKKEYDNALADYDKVLELDPRNKHQQKEKAEKGILRTKTLRKHKR